MAKQWTRNYDNLFVAAFGFGGEIPSNTYIDNPNHELPYFKCTDGRYLAPSLASHYSEQVIQESLVIRIPNEYGCADRTTDPAYSSIQLGSGDAEPHYEDYALHAPITSNMTLGTVARTTTYDEATHIYTRTYKIPIAYTGSEPITVREFGIFTPIPYDVRKGKRVLVYRETLDTPVTLEQNDTIEITFSQSIMQPNYTPYPTE